MSHKRALSLTLLIGSWLTVSVVFLAGEVVFRYGALAGILLTISFIIAFLFVIPFLKISFKFERVPYLYGVIQGLKLGESLIINLLIWFLLLKVYHFNLFSFFIGSALIIMMMYFIWRKWSETESVFYIINCSLLFALAIFLPNYLYLQVGLETVYHNLQHYHPSMIHLSLEGKWYIFLIITIIFFIDFLLHIPLLQLYMGEDYKQGVRKLIIAVFTMSTLLLAFSTMTIVAITKDIETDHYNSILLLLIQKQSTPFIFLVALFLFYVLLILELFISFSRFYSQFNNKKVSSISFIVAILISSSICYSISHFHINFSVIILFLFFGVSISVLTAILFGFLIKNYTKSKNNLKKPHNYVKNS